MTYPDDELSSTPGGELERRTREFSSYEKREQAKADKTTALKGMPEVEQVMVQVQRSGKVYGCRLSVRKTAPAEVVLNTLHLCLRELAEQGAIPVEAVPVTNDTELPRIDADVPDEIEVPLPDHLMQISLGDLRKFLADPANANESDDFLVTVRK